MSRSNGGPAGSHPFQDHQLFTAVSLFAPTQKPSGSRSTPRIAVPLDVRPVGAFCARTQSSCCRYSVPRCVECSKRFVGAQFMPCTEGADRLLTDKAVPDGSCSVNTMSYSCSAAHRAIPSRYGQGSTIASLKRGVQGRIDSWGPNSPSTHGHSVRCLSHDHLYGEDFETRSVRTVLSVGANHKRESSRPQSEGLIAGLIHVSKDSLVPRNGESRLSGIR